MASARRFVIRAILRAYTDVMRITVLGARVFVAVVLVVAVSVFGEDSAQKSPNQRAWDDVRWLATALEAYGTDNDFLYGRADVLREGNVSDLDGQLQWYYANTYPKKPAPPHVDPWGRPYRFVISESRKLYALYSLGPAGKLDAKARAFLEKLKVDQIKEDDLKKPRTSQNIVYAAGLLRFAPPEILQD